MKKIIIVVLMIAGIFVSCKKDSVGVPLGTFSARIDGINTSINIWAKASVVQVQNGHGIKILGYKKDPATSGTDFQIVIVQPVRIANRPIFCDGKLLT